MIYRDCHPFFNSFRCLIRSSFDPSSPKNPLSGDTRILNSLGKLNSRFCRAKSLLHIRVCPFWVRFQHITHLDFLLPLSYKRCRRSAYLFPLKPTKLILHFCIVSISFWEAKYCSFCLDVHNFLDTPTPSQIFDCGEYTVLKICLSWEQNPGYWQFLVEWVGFRYGRTLKNMSGVKRSSNLSGAVPFQRFGLKSPDPLAFPNVTP